MMLWSQAFVVLLACVLCACLCCVICVETCEVAVGSAETGGKKYDEAVELKLCCSQASYLVGLNVIEEFVGEVFHRSLLEYTCCEDDNDANCTDNGVPITDNNIDTFPWTISNASKSCSVTYRYNDALQRNLIVQVMRTCVLEQVTTTATTMPMPSITLQQTILTPSTTMLTTTHQVTPSTTMLTTTHQVTPSTTMLTTTHQVTPSTTMLTTTHQITPDSTMSQPFQTLTGNVVSTTDIVTSVHSTTDANEDPPKPKFHSALIVLISVVVSTILFFLIATIIFILLKRYYYVEAHKIQGKHKLLKGYYVKELSWDMDPLDIKSKVTVSSSVTSIATLIQPMGLLEESNEKFTVKQLDKVARSNSYNGAYLDICKHCKHLLVYNNIDCGCRQLQQTVAPLNSNSALNSNSRATDGVLEDINLDEDMDTCINQNLSQHELDTCIVHDYS